MPIAISRHPEAMYARFTDLPYEASLEIADNFVVDFSPDNDITGLEILWDDKYRAGSEPVLLAFGIFSAAVVWVGYHYAKHPGTESRWAVLRKVKQFVQATELPLQIVATGSTGLTVTDAAGRALLCADVQYHPRRILKSANAPKSKELSTTTASPLAEIRSTIDHFHQATLPANSDAVGVTVFIDETGDLRHLEPVVPGRWITWPEMTNHVWAHIAVIPPVGCAYPWLPDGFIPTRS